MERVSSLYLKHEGFYHKEFFLLCAHDSFGMIAMFAVVVKFFAFGDWFPGRGQFPGRAQGIAPTIDEPGYAKDR